MIKKILKKITCKHSYYQIAEITKSNSQGLLNYELKEIICKCEVCEKIKTINFKKPIDNET